MNAEPCRPKSLTVHAQFEIVLQLHDFNSDRHEGMSILQKSLLLGLGGFLLGGNVAQAAFIYVANSFNNTIVRFDASGNLYVANSGNRTIEVFDPGGHGSVFASGFRNPSFIAVQVVPEPATWAMVTLGFGALFGLRRARSALS